MIVTVQLEPHDHPSFTGTSSWPITRAILDAIEPGAGGHCVAHTETDGVHSTRHYRLGVTVEVHPVPPRLSVTPDG